MSKFKTLEFKDPELRSSLGEYAVIAGTNHIGGCSTPTLMTMDASMDLLKKVYTEVDFSSVRIIEIEIVKTK